MTRLGYQIPNFTYPGLNSKEIFNNVVEQAKVAEASGFDRLFVMDHFYQLPTLGEPDEAMMECYTLLGALAQPGAATVYIMSNEWRASFFDAVRAKYTVFQWSDIPDLKALGASCPPWKGTRTQSGRKDTHDTDDLFAPASKPDVDRCDSITLYGAEETLRSLVPPTRRVATFEKDTDFR